MTKIDDDVVSRFRAELIKLQLDPMTDAVVRGALRAALSPKPEPEIEVTEAMLKAARREWSFGNSLSSRHPDGDSFLRAAYRAMRALEPKAQEGAAYAAKSAPQGVNAAAPVKETGGGVKAKWDGSLTIDTQTTINGVLYQPGKYRVTVWNDILPIE